MLCAVVQSAQAMRLADEDGRKIGTVRSFGVTCCTPDITG